ncbi:MAG: rhodanese-like domain-containing protein, partial [Stenotrophomonas sp.]
RSAQAASQFLALGFTNVFNITGGIDAWSENVDNSVPKY